MLPVLRRLSLITFLLAILSSTLQAQQDTFTPPPHRPRIALALSGGGARGLAHIGVLQWMEENHIPVDAIAGTSMGGIIGALYATGRSPAEIRQFALNINWDDAMSGEPGYRELSFRRKEDRRADQISAALGLKNGLNGPIGLSAGQAVSLVLDRIAFNYSTIESFDDLPIPFRCVATNMLTGEREVRHDGPLAQSLRATMAIPGIFTPVDLDGKLLADGGLVDNIPTDVAHEMNADIVIAVNIGTPLAGRKELETLSAFLTQAINVMTLGNDKRALALATVKIEPVLGKFSILDFQDAEEIIRLGYEGAVATSKANAGTPADPAHYRVSDEAWQQYLAQREARKRPPQLSAQALEVAGVNQAEEEHLQRRLRKIVGRPLNLDQLDARLTRISGEGQFDTLGYEGFVQNGIPALRVVAHEKTYGPPFVDLTVNVNGSGVGAFNFSAGGRITFIDFRHRGGEWRNDLLLGSSNLAATEYYQPLATSGFFVAPYAFASKTARNAFSDLTRIAVFGDARAGGGFDLGYSPGHLSELRFGYQIFSGRLAPIIGDAGLPTVSGSTGLFRLRYVWDNQDSPTVPSRGIAVIASLSRVLQSPGLAHPIDQFEIRSSTFIPTSPKTSLFLAASGGTTFNGVAGPFQLFALGGPFRLGAYLPEEFLGNHYAYASLGFRRELFRLPQLIGKKVYWGGWYESGTAFNDPGPVVVRGTFDLGIIAETIVGPIALASSVSPTGQSRVNFSIGRLF